MNADDAMEFILAGASAVAVGTANFHNPYATEEIAAGIERYMRKHQIEDCLLFTSGWQKKQCLCWERWTV